MRSTDSSGMPRPLTHRTGALRTIPRMAAREANVMEAITTLREGGLVILHDSRLDQGDLIAAASLTTAATVAVMARHGGGLVSVAVVPRRAAELDLRPLAMRRRIGGRELCERTPTLVSVEARFGVSTGISAADRARTITTVSTVGAQPTELVRPGHVFPLVAAEGGLLERYGRLEAAVDAVRLAGLEPVAAICDVLDDHGDLANAQHLLRLAASLDLPLLDIADLVDARIDDEWGV
jgi:3,4-dihydroxy 2-butanone 4-phosphate synthase / GTP cyclohydrolase II